MPFKIPEQLKIEKLNDYNFSLSNELGCVMEGKFIKIGKMYFYALLNVGPLDDLLMEDYLSKMESSIGTFVKKGYTVIGLADIDLLTFAPDFNVNGVLELSKRIAEIKGSSIMFSTALNIANIKQAKSDFKKEMEESKSSYGKMLNNLFSTFTSNRENSSKDSKFDFDKDFIKIINITKTTIVPDITMGIITIGYQMSFKLPREIREKFPKDEGELHEFFLELFKDINTEEFESKVKFKRKIGV